MAKITVLGSGGFGTALAVLADSSGHEVTLWSPFEKEVEDLLKYRENKKLLKDIKIPESIAITTDISSAREAELVIMAVPSSAVREVARKLKGVIKDNQIIMNVGKGLEEGTLLRLSEVIAEELAEAVIVVMSGPSHAEEVARGIPTTNVVASKDVNVAMYVQDLLMSENFRLYTSTDLIGIEIGGALKNVIALSAGVCDGMGLGDNTKAALMTRGMTEMVRLGVAMGAKERTFAGLTGFGDLIVTCTSMHSRNRRAGILIGQGKTVKQALEEVGMTVEGYKTAHSAYMLAQKYNVEMPIITEVYNVLYKGKDCKRAIYDLMTRDKKHEIEDNWVK